MKHALIIEDDPLVSHALEDSLMQLGYRSFEKAWTEEDGVAAAGRRRPDLVIVGDTLESGSPIGAARRIREVLDVPVLMVAPRAARPRPCLPPGVSLGGRYPLADMAGALREAGRASETGRGPSNQGRDWRG